MRANQGSRAAPDVYGRNLGIKYGAEDAPFQPDADLQPTVGALSSARRETPDCQILIKLRAASEPNGNEVNGPPTSSTPRSTGKWPVCSIILRTSAFASASSPE
jgi:hypothetical protein